MLLRNDVLLVEKYSQMIFIPQVLFGCFKIAFYPWLTEKKLYNPKLSGSTGSNWDKIISHYSNHENLPFVNWYSDFSFRDFEEFPRFSY